jgi:PAS domain S-box-containing protein
VYTVALKRGKKLDMDNLNEIETISLQNEAILNLFYDLPFIGMAITSPVTHRWLKFNDRLCEIYGYSREELPYIPWTQITHPDDLDLDLAEYEKVMCGESEGYVMDKRYIRKDGQIIYACINVKSVRKEDRTVDFLVATVQDISDRKNAENALKKLNEELEQRIEERTADLQKSEARNLAILQALPDLLLILKHDGTCVDCIMPSTFDKTKYVPIQNHISEVLSPETLAKQLLISEKAIATGELQLYEHQLTKFGRTVHEEVRITPYSKDELLIIVRDISDRKQAEQLLLKSDTHLKVAQRIGKVGSWEFDMSTGKLTWSDEIFHIYGLEPSPNPPSYEEIKQYIYADDWDYFSETVQSAINLAKSYEIEHRLVQPNGNLIYVMARGEMIYDASGQLTHIIGTAMDISDRKLAEGKILETANQLANTNRELETFSYSVSHDLRAPLRHMNGFVSALQQQLQKHHQVLNDPKVAHYLQVIERSSQKMGNLIDGLLTLSRYGRRPLDSKQLSIRELVDEAINMIRSDPNHNPRIEFAIADLPTKYGDRTLLQQVFHNLIGNAVKFSRNQINPYIAIDTMPDGTIRIKDNGVGFQMEYADKLFGAFQRLHTQSEFEGKGIGLAIVQRIVQRHGGLVWAEGYPNHGATFFVKI